MYGATFYAQLGFAEVPIYAAITPVIVYPSQDNAAFLSQRQDYPLGIAQHEESVSLAQHQDGGQIQNLSDRIYLGK